MKTGILLSYKGLGSNLLHLSYCHEIARKYDEEGADELTFLDITASSDNRDLILDIIESVAKEIFIPLTVGGGVRSTDDVRRLLYVGADKISINTSAILNPNLVAEASSRFGSQCIVVAIDAKKKNDGWEVYTHGGRTKTGVDAVEFAKKMEDSGAGELLITSMDRDGTKKGYDVDLISKIEKSVNLPIIASGGVGSLQHLAEGIREGGASAVLAASIFHYGIFTIKEAKNYLHANKIPVRI